MWIRRVFNRRFAMAALAVVAALIGAADSIAAGRNGQLVVSVGWCRGGCDENQPDTYRALFTVSPTGGGLRLVERQANWAAFSPDGRYLAVAGEAHVSIRRSTGPPHTRRLYNAGSDRLLHWSHRSDRLAFTINDVLSNRVDDLFVGSPNGGRARRVARFAGDADWSPRGDTLAYSTHYGREGVFLRDFSTGRTRRLPAAGSSYWSWSPRAPTIAFTSHNGVSIGGLSGPTRRLLRGCTGLPTWSPRGGFVAVECDADQSLRVASTDGRVKRLLGEIGTVLFWTSEKRVFYSDPSDKQLLTQLITDPAPTTVSDFVGEPLVSADRRHFALQRERSTGFQLEVAGADGTGLHRLAAGNFEQWSPDSRRVAFSDPTAEKLWTVDLRGHSRRLVFSVARALRRLPGVRRSDNPQLSVRDWQRLRG
jgi:hypothetical protein